MALSSERYQRYAFIIFNIVMSFLRISRTIPIDNSLVDAKAVKQCIKNNSVDLLLILDASGSVGGETFQSLLDFAASLAHRMNISEAGNRIAIIQYAEHPQLEFSLNQYERASQIDWALQRIKYLSGATNTGAALNFALSDGFQNARGGKVPKVAIVVTDGQSQDNVAEAAQKLRDAHVTIYAIGVTNLVNVHQLHQIAGNPLRVFTVESFDQLSQSFVDLLTWDMCKTDFRPGTPDIVCGPNRIGVRASTRKPFDGYVFVMDHFHMKECRAGPEDFVDPQSIGITVPFTDCNVHRYRSLNPRGIFVEMTVVFMFHTVFMTKVDQMVKVQCFYMEADKTVSVPLEVSMLTTLFREKVYEMPRCEYTLRKGSADGPIVDYAQLGESIYHRWECYDQADTFGMLVHSCYVDNGYGDRVDILDSNGCGMDAVLLTTPEYNKSLRIASKPYHVFKYADRPVLQFQCQITLCIKYDDGCVELTPPQCADILIHRHEHSLQRQRHIRSLQNSHTLDVFTPQLHIINHISECVNHTSLTKTCNMYIVIIAVILNILLLFINIIFYLRRPKKCL